MSLERSQRVTVRVPNVAEMPATVETDDDRAITLVITVRPDPRLAASGGGKAQLDYTTPTGIHRLSGAVTLDRAQPEVLVFTREDPGRTIQRRDNVRVEAVVPVTVRVVDEPDRAGEMTTLNVSGGGVLLKESFPLYVGETVDLAVELEPGSARVEARGRVVRVAGQAEKGVRIERMSSADEKRLMRFVTERERVAMRLRRGR